jgi:hypothetical protein
MKLFIARLFAVILIAGSICDVCAWSGHGHMTVAAIAYRDLSPVERQKLDAILESHPQFQSWRDDFPENVPNLDQGLYIAMAASLWPDQIRNHNDPSTFPNWHFVDYPLIAPSFPDRGSPTPRDDILFWHRQERSDFTQPECGGSRQGQETQLADSSCRRCSSAALLCHFGNSIYPAPEGNRGGNEFFVRFSPSSSPRKLHSLWDGLLGTGTAANARLARSALNNAIRLQTVYPRTTLPELQSHHSVKSWSKESRESAIHYVYRDGALAPGQDVDHATLLPAGYTQHAKELAERRVVLAGYRLADEIRRVIR